MATSIEVYWKNVLIKKFPSTFPFRREAFQRIVTDVLENGYTTAEAIAKHVEAGGSGLVDFIMEGMKGKRMTPGQSEEFAKGYSQLFLLLQLGFIAGVHGSAAAEEVLRQNPTPYDDFLRRNLKRAVSLLGQDLSGETFMVQMVQEEMRRTSSIHYIEGLKAARDTLLAYTDALENYLQGHVHL